MKGRGMFSLMQISTLWNVTGRSKFEILTPPLNLVQMPNAKFHLYIQFP